MSTNGFEKRKMDWIASLKKHKAPPRFIRGDVYFVYCHRCGHCWYSHNKLQPYACYCCTSRRLSWGTRAYDYHEHPINDIREKLLEGTMDNLDDLSAELISILYAEDQETRDKIKDLLSMQHEKEWARQCITPVKRKDDRRAKK